MPRFCERVAMPGGGVAIICGDAPTRIICDVCDKPVRKGTPQFTFHGKKVDLCPACQDNRARGDAAWRAFAENAIARNLGITL